MNERDQRILEHQHADKARDRHGDIDRHIDEHTLHALRELDRIETDLDYPEKEFQRPTARERSI